jgi:peptidoglycan hydrolase-like protein with peptidoglycan-binding domain
MNNKMRQEILNELNVMLNEQVPIPDVFANIPPAEVANYITSQNKSLYTNLDEARYALDAIKTINTKEKAQQFLSQWKKLNSSESIQLKGNFNEYGRNIQKQIKYLGQKIMELSGPDAQQEPSASTKTSTSGQLNQSLAISCKRCKGVGKGCSGAEVKEVQDRLIKLGLIKESNEEIQNQKFGDFTESIVKQFQRLKKLKVDGVVGPRTCVALGLMKPAAKNTATTPTPKTLEAPAQTLVPPAPAGSPLPTGPGSGAKGAGRPVEDFKESLSFNDKKKISEAKTLFNKLLKNL